MLLLCQGNLQIYKSKSMMPLKGPNMNLRGVLLTHLCQLVLVRQLNKLMKLQINAKILFVASLVNKI